MPGIGNAQTSAPAHMAFAVVNLPALLRCEEQCQRLVRPTSQDLSRQDIVGSRVLCPRRRHADHSLNANALSSPGIARRQAGVWSVCPNTQGPQTTATAV